MNSRVLLAVALSMFFIIMYQTYFMPEPVIREEPIMEHTYEKSDRASVSKKELSKTRISESSETQELKQVEIPESTEIQEIIIKPVETDKGIYSIQNLNGAINSINLKNFYYPETNEKRKLIEGNFNESINPLKLIFKYDDEEIIQNNYYNIEEQNNKIILNNIRIINGATIEVIKEFSFFDGYLYDLKLTIKNRTPESININNFTVGENTPDEINGGLGIIWFSGIKNERENYRIKPSVLYGSNKSVSSLVSVGRVNSNAFMGSADFAFNGIKTGSPDWIAASSAFFTNILIPDKTRNTSIKGMQGIKSEEVVGYLAILDEIELAPNEQKDFYFQIYSGPKKYDILKNINEDKHLQNVIDFGWTKSIAIILLYILNMFYSFIPDYGVAIILLTILVNIILFPLKHKSTVSMEATKKVQPQINALKEKYKKDKQKFQQELMKLYREHKINPMGGCLPILVQLPIFFGLYNMLIYAIELRGASFAFTWLSDLSQADPFYVLPILFGVSMFFQQRMTPMPNAEQQKILMWVMPFFLTFLFLNFSSGLVLYFVVNNIITFGQHIFIQKRMKAKENL